MFQWQNFQVCIWSQSHLLVIWEFINYLYAKIMNKITPKLWLDTVFVFLRLQTALNSSGSNCSGNISSEVLKLLRMHKNKRFPNPSRSQHGSLPRWKHICSAQCLEVGWGLLPSCCLNIEQSKTTFKRQWKGEEEQKSKYFILSGSKYNSIDS